MSSSSSALEELESDMQPLIDKYNRYSDRSSSKWGLESMIICSRRLRLILRIPVGFVHLPYSPVIGVQKNVVILQGLGIRWVGNLGQLLFLLDSLFQFFLVHFRTRFNF